MTASLFENAILLALAWFFLAAPAAHAYFSLDLGNYLLQFLFAFGAAFWFSFRHSIRTFWQRSRRQPPATAEDAKSSDAELK